MGVVESGGIWGRGSPDADAAGGKWCLGKGSRAVVRFPESQKIGGRQVTGVGPSQKVEES